MNTSPFPLLGRYNRWFNQRLFSAAATLPDEDRRRDMGAFFGSVHATLNHILLADRIWLGRFRGAGFEDAIPVEHSLSTVSSLRDELASSFAELRSERERTDGVIAAWSEQLVGTALEREFSYRNTKGEAFTQPLMPAVTHFFNHQTHHRGQATALLSQLGVDYGVTDLVMMVREEGG